MILFWLTIKHFICDFPLQAFPWMYRNKGTYGHPGGLVHAGIHGVATFVVLAFFVGWMTALTLASLDAFLHYHIDWAKVRIGAKYGLRPDNSEWFWMLLGADQLLHMLTYFVIAIIAVG